MLDASTSLDDGDETPRASAAAAARPEASDVAGRPVGSGGGQSTTFIHNRLEGRACKCYHYNDSIVKYIVFGLLLLMLDLN